MRDRPHSTVPAAIPPIAPVQRLVPDPSDLVRPGFAAALSALLPGLGQAYGGRWRRAAVAALVPLVALALVAIFALLVDPLSGALIRRAPAVVTLLAGGALVYHIAVVADAFAGPAGTSAALRRFIIPSV